MPGDWSSIEFSELADRLSDAIAWLRGFGVEVDRARLGSYRRSMAELADASARGDRQALRAMFPTFASDLFEANEIATIHAAFRDGRHDEFVRDRLEAFASGSERYTDEGAAAGNRPRNLAFELLIGGRLIASGLTLKAAAGPDVATSVGCQQVLFECKRPQTDAKVERRATEARDQLRKHCRASYLPAIGIVALDLTKLTNPEFALLTGKTRAEGTRLLIEFLTEYFRERNALWARVADRRVVGVFLRVSILARFTDDKSLTYCQQYLLVGFDAARPLGRLTLRRLGTALESGGARDAAMQVGTSRAPD